MANQKPDVPAASTAEHAEHARWLARHDYPVPPAANLDPGERTLLARYGYWLEALATRRLTPLTPAQERFVHVAHAGADPQTPFETIWVKCREAAGAEVPVAEVGIANRLARVEAARVAHAVALEDYEARRAAILQPVQPQLDAFEAAFAGRLEALREEASRAEAEAKEAILAYGAGFKYGRIQARYARGRVTWDARGLAKYMEVHPEIAVFRRVGRPSVTFVLRPTQQEDPGQH